MALRVLKTVASLELRRLHRASRRDYRWSNPGGPGSKDSIRCRLGKGDQLCLVIVEPTSTTCHCNPSLRRTPDKLSRFEASLPVTAVASLVRLETASASRLSPQSFEISAWLLHKSSRRLRASRSHQRSITRNIFWVSGDCWLSRVFSGFSSRPLFLPQSPLLQIPVAGSTRK